ncbi:MAG: hypothetical protein ACSI46_21220 [Gloeotrichia echinulata DVL01]|nr:hypothetical protein [Gloeotrichia echinulata DEX184]
MNRSRADFELLDLTILENYRAGDTIIRHATVITTTLLFVFAQFSLSPHPP